MPNHVAPDHPGPRAHPECLLTGNDDDLQQHPEAFIRTAGGVVANGRDPYFAPWPDVVQLNAFAPALRAAVADTLLGHRRPVRRSALRHGDADDQRGLRTHLGRTARARARAAVLAHADRARKQAHPDFLFIAEAYWDMEWTLQQQGFDLLLRQAAVRPPRARSRRGGAGPPAGRAAYQERLLRFIENHDEPRAAATFGPGQARAAAVAMSTLQGARLYYEGQFEGRRTHIPVFLARGPDEPPDEELRAFYLRLLRGVGDSDLHNGEWRLCDCEGWPDNDSRRQLVAWCWSSSQARNLVVINLADAAAQARVRLPWDDVAGRAWELTDRLSDQRFERAGDELAGAGLYVELEPWASYFLAFHAAGQRP